MSRVFTIANSVQEIRTGGFALIDDSGPDRTSLGTWILKDPEKVMVAATPQAITETLAEVDQRRADLHWVALLNYELGFSFEPKLFQLRDFQHPPLMVICFRSADWLSRVQFDVWLQVAVASLPRSQARAGIADLRLTKDLSTYRRAVRRILRHIGEGDCYQVNFTWSLDFRYFGSPLALYQLLRVQQPVRHGAFVQLAGGSILSLSPELFLERRDHQLRVRPMKGTIQRTGAADADLADTLRNSEKDRAENLMIVDLMRNDLGRLAEVGTVKVEELFGIESYPTLLQMVSTISAQIPPLSLHTLLSALFPCGSVTGAPKIRAMEIIHELESRPRGLYTGSIGHLRPGGDFSFNVAIRTLELQENGIGVLGIGSGIVSDSRPDDEYAECLAKARFLTDLPVDFQLIETMAAYPNSTAPIPLLPLHLERLRKSTRYFGFRFPEKAIRSCLEETTSDSQRWSVGRRIRLRVWKSGEIYATHEPLPASLSSRSWKVALASERVDSGDIFLRHKTTVREIYDRALSLTKTVANLFDLVFLNERQEVTEGARSNLFAVIDGIWITPPVDCGLLAGVQREQILRDHKRTVIERVLYAGDLRRADQLYMSNAVRGLIQVELISKEEREIAWGQVEDNMCGLG
jgi:para-aminobenzoate synthetase / 4-amino-4-deoxychorismate lyase